MTHGSLFSGIGGFDLAAEWMGWENVFHCEWNEFGQKVLKHYWPKAISYHDITKTDFTIHRGTIDVLSGGFPCQPYSLAGKRLGKKDERHLWPEMLRAIREIQPQWVVGENVFGIINWSGGLVFEEVQADLEAEGYEVQPYVLPACGVNAPHKRDRVWFVAYRKIDRFTQSKRVNKWQEYQSNNGNGIWYSFDTNGKIGTTSNSESEQSERLRPEQRENSNEEQGQFGGNGSPMGNGLIADTDSIERCKRGVHSTESEKTKRHISPCDALGNKWDTWQNFPTQPPVCGRNDEFSGRLDGITFPKWRNESIKAYGNAVVPALVFQIFKSIQQYNDLPQIP